MWSESVQFSYFRPSGWSVSVRLSRWEGQLWAFVLIVLFSACTGPLASGPTKVYRVGALSSNTEAQSTFADELRQALREFGYVEGRNLSIEVRYAEGRAERYPVIAAELVALKLDVIVTRASQGVQALKLATSSTPIVMAGGI